MILGMERDFNLEVILFFNITMGELHPGHVNLSVAGIISILQLVQTNRGLFCRASSSLLNSIGESAFDVKLLSAASWAYPPGQR